MFGKKENEDYSVRTVKVGVDKLTTITLGTVVKGTIAVEGDLRLDRIIGGNVSRRGKMAIGPQGRIKGNVTCTGAMLHGVSQGGIQVTRDPIMKSGHTVNGDVYTCRLEIESKVGFNGTCNTTEKDALVTSRVVKPEAMDTGK